MQLVTVSKDLGFAESVLEILQDVWKTEQSDG